MSTSESFHRMTSLWLPYFSNNRASWRKATYYLNTILSTNESWNSSMISRIALTQTSVQSGKHAPQFTSKTWRPVDARDYWKKSRVENPVKKIHKLLNDGFVQYVRRTRRNHESSRWHFSYSWWHHIQILVSFEQWRSDSCSQQRSHRPWLYHLSYIQSHLFRFQELKLLKTVSKTSVLSNNFIDTKRRHAQ